MDHLTHCPKCNDVLVKSTLDEVKVRAKVIVFKGGKGYAVCPRCSTESEVPVLLDEPVVKSLKERARTPLYLRK